MRLYILIVASLRNYFQRKLDEAVSKNLPWIVAEYGDGIAALQYWERTRSYYKDGAASGRPLTPEAVLSRLSRDGFNFQREVNV